jgi:hypothetical protein
MLAGNGNVWILVTFCENLARRDDEIAKVSF